MKLNWVTIRVRDLDRSLLFYHGLLKLDIAEQFGSGERRIAMLGRADGAKIELICEPGLVIDSPGGGVSIGLEADDLEGLLQVLRENGYRAAGPVSPNPHIRFFFVQDPDGYTVQLAKRE